MDTRDTQTGLVGVSCTVGDCLLEQWPGRDRLAMSLVSSHARKDARPVVNQRHDAGHQVASLQILRREPGPAPLIFQLVKRVLGTGAIPVALGYGEEIPLLPTGHQHGMFIPFAPR